MTKNALSERNAFPERWAEEELNAEYGKLGLDEDTIDLLRQYFKALANVYGTLPLKSAYRIVRQQMSDPPTPRQFQAFARVATHEPGFVVLSDVELPGMVSDESGDARFMPRIITDGLNIRESLDAYREVRASQRGKKLRVLPQDELLRYADTDYTEATPQRVELVLYLKKLDHPQDVDLQAIPGKVRQAVQKTGANGLSAAFAMLDNNGFLFGPEDADDEAYTDAMNDFLAVLMDFANNTRLWTNRGATPMELTEQLGRAKKPQRFDGIELGPNIRAAIASGEIDAQEYMDGIDQVESLPASVREDMKRQVREAAAHRHQKG